MRSEKRLGSCRNKKRADVNRMNETSTKWIPSPKKISVSCSDNRLRFVFAMDIRQIRFQGTKNGFNIFSELFSTSRNILAETSNPGLDTVLLSCLVFGLQKTPSLELELRTVSRSFDIFKKKIPGLKE